MLLRCLSSISLQTFLEDPEHETLVIVGDNNPDASATALISSVIGAFPVPLSAIHVPDPGLCMNRNALAQAALDQQADIIVLIDDDEWAEPDWLATLIAGMEETGADAMQGPVRTIFHPDTPEWFRLSGIGQTDPRNDTRPTGAPSPKLATHNTILRAQIFRDMPTPWFPVELNFLGSEDQAFFWKAKALGYDKILWCAGALVSEEMPLERSDRKYFTKRSLQRGASAVVAAKVVPELARTPPWKVTVKEIGRLFLGLPFLLSRKHRSRYERHVLYVYGRLQGHLGRTKKFYGG